MCDLYLEDLRPVNVGQVLDRYYFQFSLRVQKCPIICAQIQPYETIPSTFVTLPIIESFSKTYTLGGCWLMAASYHDRLARKS